jgi:hypothetical protein
VDTADLVGHDAVRARSEVDRRIRSAVMEETEGTERTVLHRDAEKRRES